jgi:hypothetical protein
MEIMLVAAASGLLLTILCAAKWRSNWHKERSLRLDLHQLIDKYLGSTFLTDESYRKDKVNVIEMVDALIQRLADLAKDDPTQTSEWGTYHTTGELTQIEFRDEKYKTSVRINKAGDIVIYTKYTFKEDAEEADKKSYISEHLLLTEHQKTRVRQIYEELKVRKLYKLMDRLEIKTT